MIKTIAYMVIYRRSKMEPKVEEIFVTAEAAYHFALDIETNGGVTIVTPVERFVAVDRRAPKLNFED